MVSFVQHLVVFTLLGATTWSAATFDELSARATAARDANQLADAVRLYRDALQLNPQWQEGWWSLGTILYDTNEYAGCREAMGRLVELKSDAAPAWGILGLCEFEVAEYAASLAHIQRTIESGASL